MALAMGGDFHFRPWLSASLHDVQNINRLLYCPFCTLPRMLPEHTQDLTFVPKGQAAAVSKVGHTHQRRESHTTRHET
jgi:hypothetical protein